MKKVFRSLLCAALTVMALSIPAFAAETAPEAQGDFGVLVNGEYVAFTDAVPKIKDDRSCLPFVAVFEQLGFAEEDMVWDGVTKTVTATKDDVSIALTIGKNQIVLTRDGETQTIETDVAPYIEPSLSRTYVPFGLVADALGYNVGWDGEERVVIIDDVAAILEGNEETYELMDKYLAYNRSFYEKNYKVSGDYAADISMDMASAGENMAMGMDMGGNYEMYMAGPEKFQFTTEMTMDVAVAQNGVDMTEAVLGEETDLFPMTLDLDMRGDLMNGVFYYQSKALAEMMEQPGMAEAWYKMDLAAMMDSMSEMMGMDYQTLMQASMASVDQGFAETLETILAMTPPTSVDATTTDVLRELNALVGDSAFEKSGSKYVSTMEQDGVTISLALLTSGSKVNGYEMTMSCDLEEMVVMEMTTTMKGSEMTADLTFDMAIPMGEDAVTVHMGMTMDGTYQVTSKTPAAEPPAGATVIDMMAMADMV